MLQTPVARSSSYVLLAGAALRLALFATSSLSANLSRRPELNTPITSFRSLKEGVHLYQQGTDPYNGGVFHHSPLYLLVFAHAIPVHSNSLTAVVWTMADLISAVSLIRLWRSRGRGDRDALIAALFLFNPYAILSCVARTTTSLDNTILLGTTALAAQGRASAFPCLALAAHLSLYPALLLPPLLMLMPRKRNALIFATSFLILAGINQVLLGGSWPRRTWGTILSVSDLTPNVGMWWYFFTEMFDHFRIFFLGVFQLHNVIYVAPLCLRLRDDPLLVIMILVGIFSTWKSYPTLGDLAGWSGLLACFPEIISNLRHPLFTLTVYLYTLILLPLLHSLWLLTGTGNANFFYAATMVHGLNTCLAVVDVLGAVMRQSVKRGVAIWPDRYQVVQLNSNA